MGVDERLEMLTARIAEDTKAISLLLDQATEPIPDKSRQTLLDASWELQTLVMSPGNFLELHQIHYQQLSCLRWLLQFNILAHLPPHLSGSGTPFATIAEAAKVPLTRLKSVARMSMTRGFLSEPEPEYLAHSRISAQFVAQPALQDWARFMTEYSAPTAERFAEATLKWGDTVRKDQTAFNVAFQTDMPFFEHFGQNEETAALFARYMRSLAQNEGLAMRHVLKGFDWAALGSGLVVDVGGSTGEVATLLAENHPSLHITVQDLPATLSSRASPSELPDSIASRISFQPHDFFTPQPPNTAADVFFLRRVLHDWPVTEARQILGHIAAAMKEGALVVVMDTLLPPSGKGPGGLVEAGLRARDLLMAQSLNSGEREMEDWVELVEGVRPRLRLVRWEQPMGSAMAMLVFERDRDS